MTTNNELKRAERMPTAKEMEDFERGERAFHKGCELEDNPFGEIGKHNNRALMWSCGWTHANVEAYKKSATQLEGKSNERGEV